MSWLATAPDPVFKPGTWVCVCTVCRKYDPAVEMSKVIDPRVSLKRMAREQHCFSSKDFMPISKAESIIRQLRSEGRDDDLFRALEKEYYDAAKRGELPFNQCIGLFGQS